jgi:hypothetical protein
MEKIQNIHLSLVNDQRRQMVDQINEYGSDFWNDYKEYLKNTYETDAAKYDYFTDATISYFRRLNR